MKTIYLTCGRALACAVVLLAVGCDARPPVSDEAACVAPDGAASPDGIGPNPNLTGPGLAVTVALGLRADLDAAFGFRPGDPFVIGDKITLYAGYGVDLVYMTGGGLTPAWGAEAKPGVVSPMVVSFGGSRSYAQQPALPPHPEFATARALFDAMTNVPETTTPEGRFRESPGHRVVCRVPSDHDAAYCSFTGVISAHVF